MERLYISGETIDLVFEFFDMNGAPIDVTDVKLKVYNEVSEQIGTTTSISDSYKIGIGKYEIKYIIPDGEGKIYIQCSANNGNYEDIKRLEVKRTFYSEKKTITLTVNTNTYISLEDANDFFNTRLNSDIWDFASDTDKAKALITATQKIDTLAFRGTKYLLSQTLQFPRAYHSYALSNRWGNMPYSSIVTESTVPEDIKRAVCLEAQSLLEGASSRTIAQQQGVKSIKAGNFTEVYVGAPRPVYSIDAMDLLKPYMVSIVPII